MFKEIFCLFQMMRSLFCSASTGAATLAGAIPVDSSIASGGGVGRASSSVSCSRIGTSSELSSLVRDRRDRATIRCKSTIIVCLFVCFFTCDVRFQAVSEMILRSDSFVFVQPWLLFVCLFVGYCFKCHTFRIR